MNVPDGRQHAPILAPEEILDAYLDGLDSVFVEAHVGIRLAWSIGGATAGA
jgi:hypothetical protein